MTVYQWHAVFYRFRYALGTLLVLSLLVGFAAVVTATGSGTIFDVRSGKAAPAGPRADAQSGNAVTDLMYATEGAIRNVILASGTTIYGSSRALADGVTTGAQAVGRGSVAAAQSVGKLAAGIVSFPGAVASDVANGRMVSAAIRPADDSEVPVIDSKTSAAILEQLSAQERQKIAALQAGQLAANRTLSGTQLVGDAARGGYPDMWDRIPQDSTVDSWGMYNRECVSYAAWKVHQTYGTMPYWGGIGNANQWVRNAQAAGIPTSTVPKVHSVAISMAGYYGHAMWVEAVKGDMIYVSQYNYDLRGRYSEMWISAANLTYIYFR